MALTAIEALREIQAQIVGTKADAIPADWKTEATWATEAGLSRSTVGKTLRDGVQIGMLERKIFRVVTDAGIRNVWHYRVIEKPAKKK